MLRRGIPRATYRLQLNREFTFEDAARIVPYLARLGISHVYASPILKARPGSLHGYDVTDHSQLNPELGTRESFDMFVEVLHGHGMGLIVDIVPNHLGIMGDDNEWWLDLLENGPAGRCASHFDVDWRPLRPSMHDRVLVPILGAPYGEVLERGDLKLELDMASGSFAVRYYEHRFPIDPREYPRIFAPTRALLEERFAADDPDRGDLESLLTAFGHLPARNDISEEAVSIRYRDKEAHKRRLVRLLERSEAIRRYIDETIERLNGTPGAPESFDALHELLEAQAYRLAYWRVAVDEINYRRFFDVNNLAALRMEQQEVFESTHALTFELIEQGKIDGLRIDHSDGLYDPKTYFERLQQRFATDAEPKSLYVVTEKILAPHERLPEAWAVHGTTGYEFAALVTSWLVCGEEERRLTARYRQFTNNPHEFAEIAYRCKKLVMSVSLAAEVEVLATQLDRIAQLDRHTADFTRAALRDAIVEVIACFPVYRTYISHEGIGEEDRRIVRWAVSVARKRSAGERSVFDFLAGVLLGDAAAGRPASHRHAMREFAMKFQQVTAPVTAKGVEDTAFYRYNRLICLNEVGGDPSRFSVSSSALHQANLERAKSWPHSMLATSTHDTKRSEDVRARIAVISELTELWRLHLARWSRLNRGKRRQVDNASAPTRDDEYMIYQTLAGVWQGDEDPTSLMERMRAYVIKAAREAKRSTSWLNPNEEYEAALCSFVEQLLEHPERNAFLHDFRAFAETIAFFGGINSLAQTVLKLTVPGVPDIYQGTERLSFMLVDPDNRRPVDYAAADAMLAEIERTETANADPADMDALKLRVTWSLLQARKRDPALFELGSYVPLTVEGSCSAHLFAFAREHEQRVCVVVVPRWSARLKGGALEWPVGEQTWGDTELVAPFTRELRDVFTGRAFRFFGDSQTCRLRAAEVLSTLPVACLFWL